MHMHKDLLIGVGYLVVIDSFFDQTVSLALDGLMLSVMKEMEGIRNCLMKMMLQF